MTSKLALLALALVPALGCATTAGMERATNVAAEPRSGVKLALVAESTTAPSFPTRLTRPTASVAANRLAPRVASELGGRARADLRLCVGGNGAVSEATIARSSGIGALDDALVADARTWRYQPLAAAGATACQNVQIDYVLR